MAQLSEWLQFMLAQTQTATQRAAEEEARRASAPQTPEREYLSTQV
jgi:hypothetical protein